MNRQLNHPAKHLDMLSRRRGTKEMDVLLGAFADAHLQSFEAAQLSEYQKLLECDDNDITDWVTGRTDIPAELRGEISSLLLRFAAGRIAV